MRNLIWMLEGVCAGSGAQIFGASGMSLYLLELIQATKVWDLKTLC